MTEPTYSIEWGCSRVPQDTKELTPEEEQAVLQKLAEIRGTPEVEKYNSDAWIWRAVVASSRLSGIEIADICITCSNCGQHHSIYKSCE